MRCGLRLTCNARRTFSLIMPPRCRKMHDKSISVSRDILKPRRSLAAAQTNQYAARTFCTLKCAHNFIPSANRSPHASDCGSGSAAVKCAYHEHVNCAAKCVKLHEREFKSRNSERHTIRVIYKLRWVRYRTCVGTGTRTTATLSQRARALANSASRMRLRINQSRRCRYKNPTPYRGTNSQHSPDWSTHTLLVDDDDEEHNPLYFPAYFSPRRRSERTRDARLWHILPEMNTKTNLI